MKRLILILMLLAGVATAGGYVSGGGLTSDQVDKKIADIIQHHTFDMPTTSIATTAYVGGYYYFSSSADDFSPLTSFGYTDNSYAAHFMIVTGATASNEITITITGDKITDSTNVETGYVDTITIPSGTLADTYFETSTKWLGQITIETTGGPAINCNYGYCKYWDNGNVDFSVVGGEAIWMGDFTGETINIELIHHKPTGWTYNAAGEPDPPTPLFSMVTAHGTNVEVRSNGYGCFKKVAPSSIAIDGDGEEGVIIRFTQSRSACIEYGQFSLRYIQD